MLVSSKSSKMKSDCRPGKGETYLTIGEFYTSTRTGAAIIPVILQLIVGCCYS